MSQSYSTAENSAGRRREAPVLGEHRTRYVRDHIGILTTLIEAVGDLDTFTVADLPPAVAERIEQLHEHNIIRVEGWVNETRCVGRKRRAEWSLDRRAREGIAYWRVRIETWPCGHAATGFKNLADEPGYTCPREHCKSRFGRAVVEERFG